MAPSETACINSRKLCMVCMAQLFQQITWLFEIRCALLERNHVKFYLVFDLKGIKFDLTETFLLFD